MPDELPAPGFGTSGLEGEAIEASDVDREELFLATKVHPDSLAPEDVLETTEKSLDRLGVERVDLLYVHWPVRAYDAEATLPAFDRLREAGRTRHVDVSNFTPELLAEARERLTSPVFAHQVECHPLLPQDELLERAEATGHHLVAYSPLGRGEVLDHLVLRSVADDLGSTPAAVALAWLLDRGIVPIPKARGAHITENLAAREFDLTDEAPWN